MAPVKPVPNNLKLEWRVLKPVSTGVSKTTANNISKTTTTTTNANVQDVKQPSELAKNLLNVEVESWEPAQTFTTSREQPGAKHPEKGNLLLTRIERLHCALNTGLRCLASAVINVDKLDFGGRNIGIDDFQEIVNVLSSMSNDTLEALIVGNAHKLFGTATLKYNLPKQETRGDCPMVYCLVICDESGFTPSRSEILKVIDLMEGYLSENDDEAYQIDNVSSGHPKRNWTKKTHELGGRRFIVNQEIRQPIAQFCATMREKVAEGSLTSEGSHHPLPWSITNIGYTKNPQKRDISHRCHERSHCLKNLFESCLQLAAPGKGFYARMIRLMHPLSPKQAAVAEHVVSILAGSYHFYGGLNGSMGGVAVESSARKIPVAVWDETFRSVDEQGVFREQKGRVVREGMGMGEES